MLKQTWNSFNTKFQTQWKDRESSYHVRIILGLFRHSIALILGLNSVKNLRVTKNAKEIKFEGVWGELESKKVFRDNNSQNIWDLPLFSCEIAHNRKIFISVFQELSASTDKTLILEWILGTRLSVRGV